MVSCRTFHRFLMLRQFIGKACQPPFVELTMLREATRSGAITASRAAIIPPMLSGEYSKTVNCGHPGVHPIMRLFCSDAVQKRRLPVSYYVSLLPLQMVLRMVSLQQRAFVVAL